MGAVLARFEIESALVSAPVVVATLAPDGPTTGLPVLLWLHGGGRDEGFLEQCRPLFERGWDDGSLPPMVVVTPAAGRSFYLDDRTGAQRWETFLVDDLLEAVRGRTGASPAHADTAIGGVSMGGMGALRAAFRRPERFAAVAAVEPAIEPTAEWTEVQLRDRIYRDDAFLESLYGSPVDADFYRAHHPLHLAAANATAIVASGLGIFVECGTDDVLGLHRGADALHRVLLDHGVRHEVHLNHRDHVGPSLDGRLASAIRFVGTVLRPPPVADDPLVGFLHTVVRAAEVEVGYRRTDSVGIEEGSLEVTVVGEGPPVVLLPSLGRGASDFTDLASRLAGHGYTAICPEPRGIGGSTGLRPDLSLADLAGDVAAVIDQVAGGTAVVVGHAFGNRVARMTATEHPGRVVGVACLAAGGLVPPPDDLAAALRSVFDPGRDAEEHAADVRRVFFAPGNEPGEEWLGGWHGDVAAAQGHATRTTPIEHWWMAGTAPVLVVQGADDVFAVPANAERLASAAPDRVTVRTVPRAGHALLPEQPAAILTALLGWLRTVADPSPLGP